MISFSPRNLKEHWKKPLGLLELKFLKNTFSRACGYFFLFGVLLTLSVIGVNYVSGGHSWFLTLFFLIVALVFQFPLVRNHLIYRNNPVTVTKQFVTGAYTWLIVTFLSSFLAVSSILVYFLSTEANFFSNTITLIAVVFVSACLVYAIPLAIALFLANKRMIISLRKFAFIGSSIYIVLSAISITWLIFSPYSSGQGSLLLILELVSLVLLFTAPIITIYKLKTVIRYINHEDAEEVKRWETYFVFEIVYQLLALALTIMKIILRFLQSASRSRLG